MPDETGSDVDVVVAPTLPSFELPEYHGRKAVGMKTGLTGAGSRIGRSHEIGERVVLVVEAKVKKAGHEETDDGLVYVESHKAVDVFELAGKPGKRLLSALRHAHRIDDDDRNGKKALEHADERGEEDLTSAGVVDASGTVLTKEELAELRGDPVRTMLTDAATPVVVVFSDGARSIWPDEFEVDEPRPSAGDKFETEDVDRPEPLNYVYVAKILDSDTGETLEEWSDEQEDERLKALEAELELDEGAQVDRSGPRCDKPIDKAGSPCFREAGHPGECLPRADVNGAETSSEEFVEDPDGFAAPIELPAPTEEDRDLLAKKVGDLKAEIALIDDPARIRRLLTGEAAGKERSTIAKALGDRLLELESGPAK